MLDEIVLHVSTGIVYTPPEYPERDYSEAPRFTTPLINHAATVGYTTKLLCSVRGSPMVRHYTLYIIIITYILEQLVIHTLHLS